MDEGLFECAGAECEPLASRVRPRTIDGFFPTGDAVKSLPALRREIEEDRVPSLIISGPPGCGKTTLASIISSASKKSSVYLNAASVTLTDIKSELSKAESLLKLYGKKTIFFIDEIHRLTRPSQDALLPLTEKGVVTLVAATTENPYFTLSNALVSRSRVIMLTALSDADVRSILEKALSDNENGPSLRKMEISDEAMSRIVSSAKGDARVALNLLENAAGAHTGESPVISAEDVENSAAQSSLRYDRNGDMHYDSISAFIKSMRGSDPDAALFYLFHMLKRGEDPLFIFRRMLIFAAEDVGLADPNAITVVTSCKSAFESVGLPEGEYHLSMAALYLSLTFKSSSVSCYFDAKKAASEINATVPLHLRNKGPESDKYKYPHFFPYHYVRQQYLPDEIGGRVFYTPGELGFEKKLKELHEFRKKL